MSTIILLEDCEIINIAGGATAAPVPVPVPVPVPAPRPIAGGGRGGGGGSGEEWGEYMRGIHSGREFSDNDDYKKLVAAK